MKIELSEQQIKNLLIFLNRVKFEGLTEHQALGEIVCAINNPIADKQ